MERRGCFDGHEHTYEADCQVKGTLVCTQCGLIEPLAKKLGHATRRVD